MCIDRRYNRRVDVLTSFISTGFCEFLLFIEDFEAGQETNNFNSAIICVWSKLIKITIEYL